jgi:small subunit ribosomal protein S1
MSTENEELQANAPPPAGEPQPPPKSEDAASTGAQNHVEEPQGGPAAATEGGPHGGEADHGPDQESDAGDAPESGAPAEGAAAEGGAPGAPGKRKRRRRKKKKGAVGAEGAQPQEGLDASPEAAAEGDASRLPSEQDAKEHGEDRKDEGRKRDKSRVGAGDKGKRPPRELRERPAFGVGDVVFGKILEIQEEAILVDLSGKARAIFDRAELAIPDEPANQPITDDEDAPGAPVIPAALREEPPALEAAPEPPPPPEPPKAETEAAPAPPPEHAAETEAAADAADAEAAARSAPPPAEEPAYLPPVVLEVGASFVGVVHNDGARGGLVVITRHPRRAGRAKTKVFEAFKNQETQTVMGLVTGAIKGGVEVDLDGLRAFAPGSHVDTRLGADLHYLLGKRLNFTVTQYAKKGRDIVLSRKRFIEVESKAARIQALAKLDVGGELEGIVRSIVPFGAFVDVGGIEGLIPLNEMSHNRADTPHDIFKVGEPTKVKIVKVDEKGKVWLSRKATIPDPWMVAVKKYAPGTKHKGKVVRLQPFGAFVELEPGIDGLIHTADISIKRVEHPSEVVKVNDEIEIVVASVDGGGHRIALHPAPQGDEANEPHQRVHMHKPVKVKVVQIEQNGLVVRVMGATGRNARGYIPAGGTGTPRGTELRKAFNIGQELEAKVIDIDSRRGEVKLSVRALNEDTERSAYKTYQQQVKKEAKFTMGDLLAKKLQK